jgi:HlyD family secretion protein
VSAKVAEGAQGLSFAVKIRLEKTDGILLRPGMSCRVEIFTDIKDDVLAVPIQAIRVDEDRSVDQTLYHVFVHEDGEVHQVEVEIGLSDDTYQEITDGLSEDDEVVIGPDRVLRNLEDGDDVAILESE